MIESCRVPVGSHHRPCFLRPHTNRSTGVRPPMSSVVMDKDLTTWRRRPAALKAAWRTSRSSSAGVSGLAAASPEPPAPRAALRGGAGVSAAIPTPSSSSTPRGCVPLDTGFLVHNGRAYPNLVPLFGGARRGHPRLGHVVRGVVQRSGLGSSARRQRVLRPAPESPQAVAPVPVRGDHALQPRSAALLDCARCRAPRPSASFSSRAAPVSAFPHRYLFPMASAIWSTSLDAIRSFPRSALIRFFDDQGLLSLSAQPTWKVVAGGSPPTFRGSRRRCRDGHPRRRGDRDRYRASEHGVTITFGNGRRWRSTRWCSPATAMGCCRCWPIHASASATSSGLRHHDQVAWLHTDASVLPVRRARARRGTTCWPPKPMRRRW